MATIDRTPPQAPKWRIEIDEIERGYLLAAFDFARRYLHGPSFTSVPDNSWPSNQATYLREIGQLEQVVASVNPQDLHDA